jgi:hypothetical protein
MGKRSNFKRVARDFYPTPLKAVIPLIPHIKEFSTFVEPCAGDGSLIDILEDHGMSCTSACDIAPQREDIATFDAINLTENEVGGQ